jgi:hypothetical protein
MALLSLSAGGGGSTMRLWAGSEVLRTESIFMSTSVLVSVADTFDPLIETTNSSIRSAKARLQNWQLLRRPLW